MTEDTKDGPSRAELEERIDRLEGRIEDIEQQMNRIRQMTGIDADEHDEDDI